MNSVISREDKEKLRKLVNSEEELDRLLYTPEGREFAKTLLKDSNSPQPYKFSKAEEALFTAAEVVQKGLNIIKDIGDGVTRSLRKNRNRHSNKVIVIVKKE